MEQNKIQKALRLTAIILESEGLTDQLIQDIKEVQQALEEVNQQKESQSEKFKLILVRLVDLVITYLPAVTEIIKTWMQEK